MINNAELYLKVSEAQSEELLCKSSFNHYRYIFLVFGTGIMYDIGILTNTNETGSLSTQCFCTFSQ